MGSRDAVARCPRTYADWKAELAGNQFRGGSKKIAPKGAKLAPERFHK
jgi:hypothetical protein